MKFDEKNIIVNDVLTTNEIDDIYFNLKNPTRQYVKDIFSQSVTDFFLPEHIANKIIKYCENISGVGNLEISEYQFARYLNSKSENGTAIAPNLFPHYDEAFGEPRFTFDYQIGGNTSWPIVVEGKEFTLSNNQALTFSGTHQVHWRTKKIFEEHEYVDMVFFHLREKGALPKSKDLDSVIRQKVQKYKKDYDNE